MNVKFFLAEIISLILILAGSAFAESSLINHSYSNVAYASISTSQVCNIYCPSSNKKKLPVIILVHGGGFAMGSQNDPIIQPVIEKALANGYIVVSVDYRKSSEAVFPAALADVKAAVRWVKANAGKYKFDDSSITIWGESAGAYLSTMTALTPEVISLNGDVKENLEYSSSVNNLVSFYAPIEFFTMDADFEELGLPECANHNKENSFESAFLGQALNQDKEKTYKTYWETYSDSVRKTNLKRAWIQAGSNDKNVPYVQSKNLAERLNKVARNTKIHYSIIDGAGHMDSAFYSDENISDIFEFIK